MSSKAIRAFSRCLVVYGLMSFQCLTAATLHETRQEVWTAQTLDGPRRELSAATFVPGPQFIVTGPKAGAEIDLDQGTFRLGENTIVELADARDPIRLHQGSVLFHLRSSSSQLLVSMPDFQASLQGETGFVVAQPRVEKPKPALVVGAVAGTTRLRVQDQTFNLAPSHLAAADKTGTVRTGPFDLARQVQSSVLINGFRRPWPDAARVEKEVAKFKKLQQRGFVRAPSSSDPRVGGADPYGYGPHLADTTANGMLRREAMRQSSDALGSLVEAGAGYRSVVTTGLSSPSGANPPSGWTNPRNPHFGQPIDLPVGLPPGHGGIPPGQPKK